MMPARMSTRPSRRLSLPSWLVLTLALLGWPLLAQAQAPDTSEQQLPEIAPREIEIRGELQVSFPSLQRQPLRGFASPPTIPTVPPTRTPYAESYKQELASLPESLPAPESGPPAVSRPASPESGYLALGAGRYTSRFVAARYNLDLSPAQSLALNANYFGRTGFTAVPAADLSAPTDEFDGRLRFESRHDGLAVRVGAHGQADRYTLYGRPGLAQGSDPDAQSRTGLHGGASAELQTFGPVESRLALGVDRTAYRTERAPSVSTTDVFTETRLHADGHLRARVASRPAYLEAAASRPSYGGDVPGGSGHTLSGGLGAEVFGTERLTVEAGVRMLSFGVPDAPRSASSSSATATFIMPEGRLELGLTPGLTLFGENEPRLAQEDLLSLYEENPYATQAPSVRPTLYTTDAGAGLVTTVGPLRLQSRVGYRYAPSYRFFVSPTVGGRLSDTPIQVGYGSARILEAGGQIALQGLEGVELSLDGAYRDGTLVGPDVSIPYFSPFVAHALLSVSFADQKGLLQTTGTIETARPVDAASEREVDAYVAFDVEGSYQITSLLDVVLRVKNLSPQAPARWARYPQPPATVMGGFRIHW
jgi:hypothetical protein